MQCDEISHPEAIRILRIMTASGWGVEICSNAAPFEVLAQRPGESHTASGRTIAIAICNLAEKCGIDIKPAA